MASNTRPLKRDDVAVRAERDPVERDCRGRWLRHWLAALAEAGKLVPAIERTYALADTPDAMRHLASGKARGKLVIVP